MKKSLFALAILPTISVITTSAATTDDKEVDYKQLTDIPTLYIDTENGAAVTNKPNYVRTELRYVDESGITVYDAANIRHRGNGNFAKRSYRVKFDKKQRFLGPDRAKAKNWTLLANHADKTMIRNAVASFIGTFAGQPFTAGAKFVDLVLNGEYKGTYQISDQIDIRKRRVDITEQELPMDQDPNADITGGYLFEVSGDETVSFSTHKGVTIHIKSPDDDVINSDQIDYIAEHVNKFEDALYSSNFADVEKGYRQYVDSCTLASWYISSELTANVDCFWSVNMYKERGDDKLYWGPLWDFDIAFNNCNRTGDVYYSLMRDAAFSPQLAKQWAIRMWQDPWFVRLIADKWQEMVDGGVEQSVLDYIDQVAAEIEQSQQLNYDIWPINKRVHNEIELFDTYAEGVEYLKNFVSVHCAFLTEALAEAVNDNPTVAETFEPNPAYVYRVQCVATNLMADVAADGAHVELNSPLDSDLPAANAQRWYFTEADEDGYYRIVNYSTDLAVEDGAVADDSAGIVSSQQLRLATPDEWVDAQQWSVQPVLNSSENGAYSIIGRLSGMVWDNRGSQTADGTQAITYANSTTANQQWRIIADGVRSSSKLDEWLNSPDYRLSYSPDDATLRFRTTADSVPVGEVCVYSTAGALLLSAPLSAEISLNSLPAGVYVVTWHVNSRNGSAKIIR
jgi:hypothetical protein